MTVYAVALINIHDRTAYKRYGDGFMEIFGRHGGQMLAVDENPTVVEGDWPHTRTVLISFPDMAAFDAWYHSPDYQQLAQHRFGASDARIVVLKSLG